MHRVLHADGFDRDLAALAKQDTGRSSRALGAAFAQSACVKASNADDFFDTLVVGSPGEDSAATGLDGDQSDNSAIISGAAYIFE